MAATKGTIGIWTGEGHVPGLKPTIRAVTSLLLLLITLLAVSCSRAVERIKEAGTVHVVAVPHGGPLIYQSHEELVGVDAELVKRIVERLNRIEVIPGQPTHIELRWVSKSYGGWIAGLENREGDLAVAGLGITEEAQQHVQFSDPYYTSELVLLINPTYRRDIRGTDQLKSATVGVRDSTAAQYLVEKQFSESTVSPFKTLDNAVLALRRGEVDAVIDDRNMAAYTLDTVPGMGHLEILPGTVGKIDCGVAMRNRDSDLRELVNEVITETKADGHIAQWVNEHIGDRVARVEGRHPLRLERDRVANDPRRVAIRVSKAPNFDFDIYRLANLSFLLTDQKTGKSYRSSRIKFQQRVAVSQVTVPPGHYVLSLRKYRLQVSVVIDTQDPSNPTVNIRLRRGAVDVEKG